MRSFEKMILDFIDVLEKIKMDYVIIGGIAVSAWGNPRTTKDLDIIVVLKIEKLDELHEKLQKAGFSVNKEDIKLGIREKIYFTIFDKYSEYHVDAKGVYDEVDALTVKNKVGILYEGCTMYIASAEDTVAHKLLFGGVQDIKDAESIVVRQKNLDSEYLEELCRNLEVLNEFQNMKEKIAESESL